MMSLLILLDYFELWLRDRPTDIGKNGMDRDVRRHFVVLCSFESHCQQPPFRRAGMRNCGVFFVGRVLWIANGARFPRVTAFGVQRLRLFALFDHQ